MTTLDIANGCCGSDSNSIITEKLNPNKAIWIFGYGSLIWKADFPYVDMKKGYIRGYQRRFFQNSIDHRGNSTNPGRVVTLIPATNDDKVYGVAYEIDQNNKEKVFDQLDYREKNGYERFSLVFYPCENQSDEPFNVITYNASEYNPSYAGNVADELKIAEQIYYAIGASGTNREYLYNLSNATRKLFPGVIDEHLFGLEKLLKNKEMLES